jgi:hypothetical protein
MFRSRKIMSKKNIIPGKSNKVYQMFLNGKPFRKLYNSTGHIKLWLNHQHQFKKKWIENITVKEYEYVPTGIEFKLGDNPTKNKERTYKLKEIEKL